MASPHLKLIVIRAADIERTADFYRCLGFEFIPEQHGTGPLHFAANAAGIVFEIYPAKSLEEVDRTTRLGFGVGNLAGVCESLRAKQFEVPQDPRDTPWGTRSLSRDPDGRTVELYEDRTEEAP